jgi:class 3 adenylate cyclase
MTSRRDLVHEFYKRGRSHPTTTYRTGGVVAGTVSRLGFRGASQEYAIVVRLDLNGYSTWARDRSIGERAALLDDFFSKVVPMLEQQCGVYYRDEGDCIVAIFADYFRLGAGIDNVCNFVRAAVAEVYGSECLTAKCVVACGDVAFFQKAHEAGTDDWSAEGEPFVRAARLEAAVGSRQRVYWYADEYPTFSSQVPLALPGDRYFWRVDLVSLQVGGLSLPGGWTDVVQLEYVPGGAVLVA